MGKRCLWLIIVVLVALVLISLILSFCLFPSKVQVTNLIVINDKSNDVSIYNYGGFPNVSVKSVDIVRVKVMILSNSTIILSIKLNGRPLDIRTAGFGRTAKYMFSYSLIMPVIINSHKAVLRLSYDNLVSSIEKTVSVRIHDVEQYSASGNYSIINNTLIIRAPLPASFQGLNKGEVIVRAILQSSVSEYTGASDIAVYKLSDLGKA